MSHYAILAIIDENESVEEVLRPYGPDGEQKWDWHQIGGRWTGFFDDYDPDSDPAVMGLWPTQRPARAGDKIPIAALTEKHVEGAYAVVCSWGWYGGRDYQPWAADDEKFVERPKPPLAWLQRQFPSATAVIVDCHN